ncbi:MAG: putative oxidoreductase C-terminal domain-containing protein [Cyclobacteriaceae bacterium]
MQRSFQFYLFAVIYIISMAACDRSDSVRLITLDPGHFHAALVQKSMHGGIDKTVYVYAPEGKDMQLHMDRINGYNARSENPTSWKTVTYSGNDFVERMLSEKKGNVVVLAGNNSRKTEYIKRSIEAGFDVLADKPMVIQPEQYEMLVEAFKTAEEKGLLLYDIMTERYEITSILQRELSMIPEIFGEPENGTPEAPAVVKESVHHFYKMVSGKPLIRPSWFMDTRQQGAGIVDVTTHLADLVQWSCFPEQVLEFEKDVRLISAGQWTTPLSRDQFTKVTGMSDFPTDFQTLKTSDSVIAVNCNGYILYTLRGRHIKIKVDWAFEAGPGKGDTHYSFMAGSGSDLVIRQGEEQNFKPVLYIEPHSETSDSKIISAFESVSKKFPGVVLRKSGKAFEVHVPDSYHNGHEAHFGQVLEKFLKYREVGKLPEWEKAAMLTKYKLLMAALNFRQ